MFHMPLTSNAGIFQNVVQVNIRKFMYVEIVNKHEQGKKHILMAQSP